MEPLRRTEWWSALVISLLVLVGMYFVSCVEQRQGITGSLQQVRSLTSWLMAVFAVVLFLNRKQPTRAVTLSVFTLTFCLLLYTSTVYHFEHARFGQPWVPFLGQKLIFIALAVFVAGPYWVNVLWMAIFVIQVCLLWFMTDLGNHSLFLNAFEPGYTLLNVVVAACLLAYRYYSERAQRELAAEKTRRQNVERLTHIFMSLRDLTNTPLQTLRLATELFQRGDSDGANLMESVGGATERLVALSRIFKHFDQLGWKERWPMSETEILASLSELENESPEAPK